MNARPRAKSARMGHPPFIAVGSYEALLELEHHNLGIRSQPQRRSPGSCSARSENLHLPNPAQAIHELPVNPPRHPTPRQELAKVRMTGQLQGDAGRLRDLRMVWGMCQQDACAAAIQADRMQDRRKLPVLSRIPVRNANNLQTVPF